MKYIVRGQGTELKESMEILLSLYSPSKVYYYGNYTRVDFTNRGIKMSQVNIVGEAINTGSISITVPGIGQGVTEEASSYVPTDEIKKFVKQIPDGEVEVRMEGNVINIIGEDTKITLPTVEVELPPIIEANIQHGYADKEPIQVDTEELKEVLKQIQPATRGVLLSHDHEAYLLEGQYVYVNKGTRITRASASTSGAFPNKLVAMPFYMYDVLRKLPDSRGTWSASEGVAGEPHIYVEYDNLLINFQEWYSKNEDTLGVIKTVLEEKVGSALPLTDELKTQFVGVSTKSSIIVVDYDNQQLRSIDNQLCYDNPNLVGEGVVYISSELFPKRVELNKYNTIEIGDNLVRLEGDVLTTVIATMEPSS